MKSTKEALIKILEKKAFEFNENNFDFCVIFVLFEEECYMTFANSDNVTYSVIDIRDTIFDFEKESAEYISKKTYTFSGHDSKFILLGDVKRSGTILTTKEMMYLELVKIYKHLDIDISSKQCFLISFPQKNKIDPLIQKVWLI